MLMQNRIVRSGTAEGAAPPPADAPAVGETDANGSTQAASAGDAPAVGAESAQAAPKAPAPVDWKDRRIAQLAAQKHSLETQLEAAKAAKLASPPAEPPAQGAGMVPLAEVESRAAAIAEQRSAQAEFDRQCNEVAEAGKAEFGDEFTARVGSLTQLVDRRDPSSIANYNQFLAIAIETGAAAKLIHSLGSDLNEASRVMALPAAKMAVELTKMATGVKTLSSAPKPIRPVGGNAASHEMIDPTDPTKADQLSTAAWMERRNKQLADRQSR